MKKVKEFLKKHKKLVIVLIVLLVIVGFVLYVRSQAKKALDIMLNANGPEIVEIENRSLVESLSATGSVTSIDSVNVTSIAVNTEVKEVLVEVGDEVKAGDILCILDSENLEIQRDNAQTTRDATKTKSNLDAAAAQRNLNNAEIVRNLQVERDFEDAQTAWDDYAKALEERDKAKREYDTAKEIYDSRLGEYDNNSNASNTINNNNGIAGSDAAAINEVKFESIKEELTKYMANHNITGALGRVAIASNDFELVTSDDFYYNDKDPGDQKLSNEDKDAILSYLERLRGVRNSYVGGSYVDGTRYLSGSLNTAKNDLDAKKNAFDQRETALENALNAYNRIVRAYEDNVRNNANSVANSTDNVTSAALNSKTATLNSELQIKQYTDQIDDCTVVAPMDGVITAVNVSEGNMYTGSTIATIQDISAYEVTAEIDEYDIGKVKVGQQVVIKTNGTGDTEFQGQVTKVAPTATRTVTASGVSSVGNSITYKVTMSVNGGMDQLKMDMTAKISIIIDEAEDVLTVPYDAVQVDDEGKYYVELAVTNEKGDMVRGDAEDKNNRIYVTKGIESDYYIEISGDGVKEGISIVVPPAEGGNDFMQMMMEQGAMGGF